MTIPDGLLEDGTQTTAEFETVKIQRKGDLPSIHGFWLPQHFNQLFCLIIGLSASNFAHRFGSWNQMILVHMLLIAIARNVYV